ncbi:MAG: RNA polymerase sigma factor [Acidimicrobiia bacterium]|nr:RNA polymerase sigma factor [Acidimicrobiia bacterium]MDH4308656.1 RNA polymerase sigma factor [Acidimicrobiia bacterium]MDH5294797.1 RNA polymerase sigma factor [Acidimicrobiia bacterium]
MIEATELDRWTDGIRRRSNDAFTAVYDMLATDLVSYAFGMLRDRRSAEDAVQQAFLELTRSAHRFRGDGRSLRAWLFRATRYSCLDEIRRRKRHPEIPTDQLPEKMIHPADPDGIDPRLESALLTLNNRQRELVMLRHVVGLSGAEIAAIFKRSRPAVYAALDRAETRLRSELDQGTPR